MTGVPGVTVLVDGVPLPDGCLTGSGPTVLSGLVVRWGRDNSVDQPAPALLSFEAVDTDPLNRFTGRLYVGADVIVNADAVTWTGPTVDTIAAPIRPDYSNAAGVVTGHRVDVRPVDAARSVTVTIPPLPHSTNPAAWDSVPRSQGGQQWQLTATIGKSWPQSVVTVRPVAYTGPGANVVPTELPPVDVTSGSALFTPPADRWLGVRVTWYPTGPRWVDLPPAQRWVDVDPAWSWQDYAELVVDAVQLVAPIADVARTAQLFRGRITDLVVGWDADLDAPLVDVTAADLLADLANRPVGAEPWLAETLAQRWARIGAALSVPVASSVPASVANAPITWRDVDNQGAGELYYELARSVDAQVAVGTHVGSGPTLILDPMKDRPALQVLAVDPDSGKVVIVPVSTLGRGVTLSACRVDLDPVRWSQTSADVSTRVVVRWWDQTVDDKGAPDPTERSVALVDTDAERRLGALRLSVSTQLSTSAVATTVAQQLLGRLSRRGWTVKGLRWTLSDTMTPDELDAVLDLLDATTRLSSPILLVDVPDWPTTADRVPLYLEGGTYTSQNGVWTLDLMTSSADATGALALRWVDVAPAWRWVDFDPAMQWFDLAGVGPAT